MKNGGKFSKKVENTMGKGRIICPFLTVFSKDLYRSHAKARACLRKVKKKTEFNIRELFILFQKFRSQFGKIF